MQKSIMTDKSREKKGTSNLGWSVQNIKAKFETDGTSAATLPIVKEGRQTNNMGSCVSSEDKSKTTKGKKHPSSPDQKQLQKGTSNVPPVDRQPAESDGGKCATTTEQSPEPPPRYKKLQRKGKAADTVDRYFEIVIQFQTSNSTKICVPCDQPKQWYQWDFIFQNKVKQDFLYEKFKRNLHLKIMNKTLEYPYTVRLIGSPVDNHWKEETLLAKELNGLCEDVCCSSINLKHAEESEKFESLLQRHCHCKKKDVIWHKGKPSGKAVYILVGYSAKIDEINKELDAFLLKNKDTKERQSNESLDDDFLKEGEEEFQNVFESFPTEESNVPTDKKSQNLTSCTGISQSGGEALQGSKSVKVKGQSLKLNKKCIETSISDASPTQTKTFSTSKKTTVTNSSSSTDQVSQESGVAVEQQYNGAKPKSKNRDTRPNLPGSKTEMMHSAPRLDHSFRQGDTWMPSNQDKLHQQTDKEHVMKFDSLHLLLLSKFKILKKAKKAVKQTEFELTSDNVRITGMNVKDFATFVEHHIKALTDGVENLRKHVSHQLVLDMFKTSKEFAEEVVKKEGFICHLQILDSEETQIQVYAEPDKMESVLKILKKIFHYKEYPIDKKWKLFLKSEDVKVELDALQEKHNGQVCIVKQESLHVVCYCTISRDIFSQVDSMEKDFFVPQTLNKITDQGIAEYCENYLREKIDNLERKFEVEIQPLNKDDKYGWTLQGPKGTTERALQCLCKGIQANVTSQTVVIGKAADVFFSNKSGQKWIKEVETKNKCIIVRKDQHVLKERYNEISAGNKNEQTLADGRSVGLYLGDPEQFSCDVVLKAVPQSNVRGCSYRFTVPVYVMPVQSLNSGKDKDCLRTTFIKILSDIADKQNLSIAVPVNVHKQIGWDDKKFLKVVLHAFVEEFKGKINDCRFIVEKEETWEQLMGVMEDYFKSKQDVEGKIPEQTISVVHGELAKQTECDVIVNTTSSDLQLHNGAVSNSLLKTAGKEMQREVTKNYPHKLNFGEVAVTRGYNLHCQFVFHGALPSYDSDKYLKGLRLFMLNCLRRAAEERLVSIAFPALGTGNLGYPRDEVAKVMYETVRSFGKFEPSSVTKVLFVIYQKDKQTQKAFELEQRKTSASSTEEEDQPCQGLHMKYGHSDLWVSQEDVKSVKADGLVLFWYRDELQHDERKVIFEAGESAVDDWIKQRPKLTVADSEGKLTTTPDTLPYIHILCDSKSPSLIVRQTLDYAKRRRMTSLVIVFHEKTDRITNDVVKFAEGLHETLTSNEYATLQTIKILTDTTSIKDKLTSELKTLGASNVVEDLSHGGDGTSQQQSVLVVTGHNDDVVKAVKQLKEQIENKEIEYKAKQSRQRTSLGNSVSSEEREVRGDNRPLSSQPPEGLQQSSYPCIKLSQLEYERKRLLAYPKQNSGFTKPVIKCLKEDIEHVTPRVKIVTPPSSDFSYILIICESPEIADDLLNHPETSNKKQYRLVKFEAQTVVNVKAMLNPKIIKIIRDNGYWQHFKDMFHDCGVEVKGRKENRFFEGSLLEIQFAQKLFVSMFQAKGLSLEPQEPHHQSMDGGAVRPPQEAAARDNLANGDKANTKGSTSRDSKNYTEPVDTTSSSVTDPVNKSQGAIPKKRTITTNKEPPYTGDRACLKCSRDEFEKIEFHFSSEIKNVHFDNSKGEVYGDIESFKRAQKDMKKFIREEIIQLQKEEVSRLTDMQDLAKKGIYYNRSYSKTRKLCLTGKNYEDVQTAKQKILVDVGRQKPTNRAKRQLTADEDSQSVSQQPEVINKRQSFKKSFSKKPKRPPPPESLAMTTNEGIEIYAYGSDILHLDVDGIIIPTNETLNPQKGIAATVVNAAGKDLQNALSEILKDRKLNVGEVCYTTAGELKYKCIFHMVVPVWEKYKVGGKKSKQQIFEDDLQEAILKSLKEARDNGMKCVALPAFISDVTENVYIEACMVAAVKFSESSRVTSLAQIHLVDLDHGKADWMRKAIKQCCESAVKLENVRNSNDSTTGLSSHTQKTPAQSSVHHRDSKASSVRGRKNNSFPPYCKTPEKEVEGKFVISSKVFLSICKGSITDQVCEGIVSIEDEDMTGSSKIAKAIEEKAGDRYIRDKRRKKCQIGDVVITASGKLPYENILHVVTPKETSEIMKDKTLREGYMENLRACLKNLFTEVGKSKLQSVALPMFGSGLFNPKDRDSLAQLLQEEIVWFSGCAVCTECVNIYLADERSNAALMTSTFKKYIKSVNEHNYPVGWKPTHNAGGTRV